MKSLDIENLAVSKLSGEVAKSDFLRPFIKTGDKEPLWDGNIYLLNNSSGKNDEIVHKIPVQVKGRSRLPKCKNGVLTYSIHKKNLQSYMADNGVLYFIVKINKGKREAEEIYYADLTPVKLHRALNDKAMHNKNNTVKIEFKALSNDLEKMEAVFINFVNACKAQSGFEKIKVSIGDKVIDGAKSVTFYPTGDFIPSGGLRDYENKELYASFNLEDGNYRILDGFVKVEIGESKWEPRKVEDIISIDDEVFYNEIVVTKRNGYFEILIGEFFTITCEVDSSSQVKLQQQINFNIGKIKRFDQMIKAMQFLVRAIDGNGFKVNNGFCDFFYENSEAKSLLPKLRMELEAYGKIKALFNMLRIPLDIEYGNLSEGDKRKIDKYTYLLIDENEIPFREEQPVVFIDRIGNYGFILEAEIYKSASKGKVVTFPSEFMKNSISIHMESSDGSMGAYPVPCYQLIDPEIFAEISNLDYADIYNEYMKIPDNNTDKPHLIQHLVLQTLKSYDKGGVNKDRVLDMAIHLIKAIERLDGSDSQIATINLYQAYRRVRDLTITERKELLDIVSSSENCALKAAVYLLLSNQEQAEYYFEKLSENEKAEFISWPIYHFWGMGS